ncbi:3-oxoacid CoA-transferase subunit B [Geosporobacter ferrireducens]|uniref:3-oxoacid CoA-transferase subunit B n=1 Tax=Geosporobacter ferrireducens TaxID=1424294 RepID=UPI00139B6DEB|nr:3-oxoacid CoA-transferase subunit B [Geosporobacter ferrireducens]MTI56576.1 CoA transferase subunit B [Geosporobacter ferrireducens]
MSGAREIIGKRVAKFFRAGDLVNLGIGMPTAVADYLPEGSHIMLHSENGFIGLGPIPAPGEEDKDVVNAGGAPVTMVPGGACFDSATSFALVRGGHLAATVLGALEVDENGNLANWMIPGKLVPGMGGAMDLVAGARKVIIAMEHTTKDGKPKILKSCTLPLTAANEVDYIVTELGVMEVTPEGILLKELAAGVTVGEIQDKTQARLLLPDVIGKME